MLRSLHIENLAVIDSLEARFDAGMTAVTGETGAGKSMLIQALTLALGGRARADLVRDGAPQLEVEAAFAPAGKARADTHSLRRVVSDRGRSRAFLDGRATPLAEFQARGRALADICGQNAHQILLRKDSQLRLLDAQCEHDDTLAELADLHRRRARAAARVAELERLVADAGARRELSRYQLAELERLAPEEDEFERLEDDHRRCANREALAQACHEARAALVAGDDDMVSRLAKSARALERAGERKLDAPRRQLDEAGLLLKSAADDIGGFLDALESDATELGAVEARLSAYVELARKHRVRPQELAARRAALARELDEGDGAERELDALRAELPELERRQRQAADAAGKRRRATAARLDKAVTALLGRLNMPDAALRTRIETTDALSATGCDRVDFLIRTNAGHPFGPLARVASGGELSRVSLAMQTVMARRAAPPTLIFDETDAGVGGATAETVGDLLRALSRRAQVLCVTHLPQVAARADHHFVVSKDSAGGRARARLAPLDEDGRRRELARMMAGARAGAKIPLAHAEEMLRLGRAAPAPEPPF